MRLEAGPDGSLLQRSQAGENNRAGTEVSTAVKKRTGDKAEAERYGRDGKS